MGPICQRKEKKRKRGGQRGLLRGGGRQAAGPPGRKGEEVSFIYFFFSFSNSFQTKLLISISNKTFSNFPQNFIIFLKVTQATKNHAMPNNDAQPLVVSILIKVSLVF
jgi:hypothetical protein